MLYRKYGKTGLKVSVFTFGAMRIPFDAAKLSKRECAAREKNGIATMRRAMELGINHIDTARGYGNSEQLVGLGLRELGRDKFHITTKIPIQPSRDEAINQIEQALTKLGVDKIDVLDLHGINTPELLKTATSPRGCLAGIRYAVRNGMVGHIGFSTHGDPDLIIRTMETGFFEALSLHYYWINRRNVEVVKRARQLGLGVLILSPTDKGGLLFKPTKKMKEVCHPFRPLTLLHRWLIAQPGVSTLTIGGASPADFDLHMTALQPPAGKLTSEERVALRQWAAVEKESLGKTRCTFCHECLPCPQDVAIPETLRLRNLTNAFDMHEFAKSRYSLLGHGGHWYPGLPGNKCNECGECLPRCPQNLPIPTLLKETHRKLGGEEKKRLWK